MHEHTTSKTTLNLTIHQRQACLEGRTRWGDTTVTLTDDDLAVLGDDEREWLALHLTGPAPWSWALSSHAPPIGHIDIDVLRDLLRVRAELVAARAAAEAAEQRARRDRADAEIRDALEAALSAPPEIETVRFDSEGNWADKGVSRNISLPRLPRALWEVTLDQASPEQRETWSRAIADIRRRRREIVEGYRAEVLAELEQRARRREQSKAQLAALVASLSPAFRELREAGYCSDARWERALRRAARKAAGYTPSYEGWDGHETLTDLSREEYASLVAVRASAPSGATVTPIACWRVETRPAEDGEDADTELGEVEVESDRRRQMLVEWQVDTLHVRAVVPFAEATSC